MCVRMFENSTNISVMFVCIAFTLFTSLNFVRKELISSFNRVAYFVYYDMLLQYVGDAGKKYFAFPPYIFLFIPIGNVAGSIPHVFQLTGNLAVTLSPSSVS
jgi:hypothetical protein